LARKAGAVSPRNAVGNWLYGVAFQTALRARAVTMKRKARESVGASIPDLARPAAEWDDVAEVLDEELARLPGHYRAVIVLCDVEGRTRADAAVQLGCPEGSVSSRLSRARTMLARRLAKRGVTLSAGMLAAMLGQNANSAAVPALLMQGTIEAAELVAAGSALANVVQPAVKILTDGVIKAMIVSKLKMVALVVFAVSLVGFVGFAGYRQATGQEQKPVPKPVENATPKRATPPADVRTLGDSPPANPPEAPRPAKTAKGDFEEATISIRRGFLTNRLSETIHVSANGTCQYNVPERPARGEIPAWSGAGIIHKLPEARHRELNELLKGTDWLAKDAKAVMQLHQNRYEIALKRNGKITKVSVEGESETYGKLLHFFESVAAQEYLIYRLEWVPTAMAEARVELDAMIAAELGEPFAKSFLAIDLARYTPWATRLIRNPFDKQTDDVRTAVRLVGLLKLESEREYLADLASDRNRDVRTAVVAAVGRLGGEKSVPVLRKMARSTGQEAAWELIKLGPLAVPTIAEVIREGTGEEDMSFESLIRAYIDHWKVVPKPLDAKILDAVRVSMESPKVKGFRVVYHKELLKLAAEIDTRK
jgi:hypothetical protein